MKIALIQQHATKDRSSNVARGLAALDTAANNGARLACFAELGGALGIEPFEGELGFRELAEPLDGPTVKAFQQKARDLGLVVVINLYERDGHKTFDSSPVIDADGTLLGVTRMIHITDYPCFHEQGYYTPGDKGAPVFKTKAGTIGVAICYDRHFPEYMRALAVKGADLVIVPQAGAVDEWPEGLYEAEMRVAAFQNGYFTALCNRVGKEDCLDFAGESFVCGPDGGVIARAAKSVDAILYADLDLASTANSNARRLFLKHRRPELYEEWIK
jgi:predicted amidohydrolase